MDDFDDHWHDEAATGLRIGVWVARAAIVALALLGGCVVVKALPSIAATLANPLAGMPF